MQTTYYAYGNTFDPAKDIVSLKFRIFVDTESSYMTGESYHRVRIECRDIAKNLLGKWVPTSKYLYWAEKTVHCCYNAKEAAEYFASRYGLTLA